MAVKELPGAFRDELEMPLSPVITSLSPVITGLGEVAARWGPCRGWRWAETRQGWGCEHLAGAPGFIWGQSTLLGTGYRGDRGKKPGTSLSVAPYPCPATPKQTHRPLYIFFPFNALLLPPFHMPPRPQLVAEQQGSLMGSGFQLSAGILSASWVENPSFWVWERHSSSVEAWWQLSLCFQLAQS